MSTSAPERPRAVAVSVAPGEGELVVALEDGRTVLVPLEWFPKLRDASPTQLADYRLIGDGIGIQWPQLDEDVSVKGLLMPQAHGTPVRKSA